MLARFALSRLPKAHGRSSRDYKSVLVTFSNILVMPRRKKEDELPEDQRGPPRGAANLRERTRMRVLSKAFGKLKLMLPWVPPDTKLSKLDTLRLATSYISHLQRILDENGDESGFHPEDIKAAVYPQTSVVRNCPKSGHSIFTILCTRSLLIMNAIRLRAKLRNHTAFTSFRAP